MDAPLDPEMLREAWKKLYGTTLPQLARAKDPTQPKWPVTLDHCFARIILDNTVGKGEKQWDKVIGKPAVKTMTTEQLKAAIELGQKIKDGKVDLVQLDRQSLEARGKNEGKYKDVKADSEEQQSIKRKRMEEGQMGLQSESTKKQKQRDGKTQSTLVFTSSNGKEWNSLPSPVASDADTEKSVGERSSLEKSLNTTSTLPRSELQTLLRSIKSDRSLTPFRRRLYTSLLSVPKGEYTTYAALATHLNSSARAVGNGMRNNPFAPHVPCHRVLASDGTLGGYGGDWGRAEKGRKGYLPKQNDKVKLLETEGVRFDSTGKVKGPVWSGFWDLEDFEREIGKL